MTIAIEADAVQLGRNLADKCEATFRVLLAAESTDQRLVAAAERGRREVLEAAA